MPTRVVQCFFNRRGRQLEPALQKINTKYLRQQAALEGLSLSAWIRKAALERLAERQQGTALRSVEALEAFFAECDQHERGREPDWAEHLEVINRSLSSGDSST